MQQFSLYLALILAALSGLVNIRGIFLLPYYTVAEVVYGDGREYH